jgi:hypothetical protein
MLWLTGDGALSASFAAALKQCGLDVRVAEPAHADATAGPATGLVIEMLAMAEGDSVLLCHVAANDDGVCWSFADAHSQTPAAAPLAAFRRAASRGARTASSDGLGVQIPHETLTTIAANRSPTTFSAPAGPGRPPGRSPSLIAGRSVPVRTTSPFIPTMCPRSSELKTSSDATGWSCKMAHRFAGKS